MVGYLLLILTVLVAVVLVMKDRGFVVLGAIAAAVLGGPIGAVLGLIAMLSAVVWPAAPHTSWAKRFYSDTHPHTKLGRKIAAGEAVPKFLREPSGEPEQERKGWNPLPDRQAESDNTQLEVPVPARPPAQAATRNSEGPAVARSAPKRKPRLTPKEREARHQELEEIRREYESGSSGPPA